MNSALLLLALVSNEAATAQQDRLQFPQDQWWRYYYVTTATVAPHRRLDLERAFKFATQGVVRRTVKIAMPIRQTMPVQVSPTLWRIDILAMGWGVNEWRAVVAKNKYSLSTNPLLLRADWLVVELSDGKNSDAYYLLAYGFVPSNSKQVYDLLGVDANPSLRYGMVEVRSRVSKNKTRRIENWPMVRGQAWRTRDVDALTQDKDPLEQLEGDFNHQAEEHIFGVEMHDPQTGVRGLWPRYLLSNAKGDVQRVAPVDIVEDNTKFRGLAEINSPGSCYQCHYTGMNRPTRDGFRQLLDAGVRSFSDYKSAQALQSFYLTDLERDMARYDEDYAALVNVVVGCKPTDASIAFTLAVNEYDRDLDLEDAAREHGVDASELQLALGWATTVGAVPPARVAGLSAGISIPRDAWEDGAYLATGNVLYNYQRRNNATTHHSASSIKLRGMSAVLDLQSRAGADASIAGKSRIRATGSIPAATNSSR